MIKIVVYRLEARTPKIEKYKVGVVKIKFDSDGAVPMMTSLT